MHIEEVESIISENLSNGLSLRESLEKVGYTVPQQNRPKVTLSDAKGRKKKRNASADNWSADSGQIVVRYEPVPHGHNILRGSPRPHLTTNDETDNASLTEQQNPPEHASGSNTSTDPAEVELLRALNRAESRPGWNFVPLKKFRDEILPLEHLASKLTDAERKDMLDAAINKKKLILTTKVTNPKAPQFPVTTIRLNRLIPQVAAALGQTGSDYLDFRPIEIAGEPLSTTVLRERR